MKILVETLLPVDPQRMRDEVVRPEFFRYLSQPWLDLKPLNPRYWPERWLHGQYVFSVNLFGRMKLGNQEFAFSQPGMPKDRFAFRCKSTGAWVKLWDHWIILKDAGNGQTLYRDKITLIPGYSRPFVKYLIRKYTTYHQDCLRSVVAADFTYPAYETEKSESHHRRGGQSRSARLSQGEPGLPLPPAQ